MGARAWILGLGVLGVTSAFAGEALSEGPPLVPGRPPAVTFVATPAGDVSVLDGALLLERLDLRVHTRLGVLRIGQSWSGATRRWHDWLDLTYDGVTLTDGHGTRIDTRALDGTRWVRIDDATLRTRGGRVHRFHEGLLVSIEGPGGSPHLDLERDRAGRLIRIVQWIGGAAQGETVLEVRFDAGDVVLESQNRIVRRFLDARGRLTHVRDPSFGGNPPTTTYGYDPSGHLHTIRRGTDAITLVSHDRAGSVYAVRRGRARWRFHRSRSGRAFDLRVRSPGGAITDYRHDGGRVTWRRDSDGTRRAEYRGNLLLALEDPLGARWSFGYEEGDLVFRADPLGRRRTFVPAPGRWDPEDPNGTPWARRTDPGGGVWTREFDAEGRPVALVDPAGNRRTVELTSPLFRTEHAPTGFPTCLIHEDSHGLVTRIDRGCTGRAQPIPRLPTGWLLSRIAGGLPVFDGAGRMDQIVFPGASPSEPRRLRLERDPSGRAVAADLPMGGRIELDRDRVGRVTAVRRRLRSAADGREFSDEVWVVKRVRRDRAGRVVTHIAPDGARLEIDRDRGGRIVGKRYRDPDGRTIATLELTRDPVGRVVRVDDSRAPGPIEIERDPLGKARVVRYPHGEWAEQELDAAGQLVRLDLFLPDGRRIRSLGWTRDPLGRPTALFDEDELVASVGYSPTTEVVRHSSGVVEELHRDRAGRLVRLTLRSPSGTTLRDLELQYAFVDGVRTDVLTAVHDRADTDQGFFVAYDENDHIRSWHGHRSYAFDWDILGNLVDSFASRPHAPSERTRLGYNAARTRLQRVNGEEVEHDLRGRVIRIGELRVEWEPYNRPRRLGAVELRYGVSGLPVSRTEGETETRFLFGGLVRADASLNPLTLEIADFVIDLRSGRREHLHRDVRNNVAWITDDTGALIAEHRVGPFGTDERDGSTESGRGFAGGEEVGPFVLLGARVYHPRTARFLSPDPIPDWVNPYAYAQGNPVGFWDPGGLRRIEVRRSARITISARPLPGLDVEFREEILIDEPPYATVVEGEETEAPETPQPETSLPAPIALPPMPSPPLVPPVPPVRPVGCDAIGSSPVRVTLLLALLPLLLLLSPRTRA